MLVYYMVVVMDGICRRKKEFDKTNTLRWKNSQ